MPAEHAKPYRASRLHQCFLAFFAMQAHFASKPGSSLAKGDTASSAVALTVMQLCSAVRLEVKAWQGRLPAAQQLMHPSMQPRHVQMLLCIMATAEGSGWDFVCAQMPCSPTSTRPCASAPSPSGQRDLQRDEDSYDQASLQHALLHYGLMRRDGYAEVFLPNTAANAGGVADAPDRPGTSCFTPASTAAPFGESATASSVAALLVWLTRNAATASFLSRVLDIACREKQLADQVGWTDFIPHRS